MARAKAKGTGLLIKIIFVAAIVYLLYVFIGLQMKINQKQAEIDTLDMQISSKVTEQEELTGILNAEVDTEYIEKVARELGYINSDEKVYESITE